MSETSAYAMRPVKVGYYAGLAGILAYFACITQATGYDRYRAETQRIALEVEACLADGLERITPGVPFALAYAGRVLHNPHLITVAERSLNEVAIGSSNDVLNGRAGRVLAAVAVVKCGGSSNSLAMIEKDINDLVASVKQHESGLFWQTGLEGQGLAGFAHGNSGIALALGEAAQVIGSDVVAPIITKSLAFEDSLYRHDVAEFLDARDTSLEHFTTAWCNGSPGIALARTRLARLGYIPTENVEAMTRSMTDRIHQVGVDALDHLCCGNGGRAAALLEVARWLGEPAYKAQATSLMAGMWQRGDSAFRLFPGIPDPRNVPGLLHGLAGMGALAAEAAAGNGFLADLLTMTMHNDDV